VHPDKISWDEFTGRRTAPETSENKHQEPSLSALLLQAIQLAGARRGRLSQAERIREQTLLEVLSVALRR